MVVAGEVIRGRDSMLWGETASVEVKIVDLLCRVDERNEIRKGLNRNNGVS